MNQIALLPNKVYQTSKYFRQKIFCLTQKKENITMLGWTPVYPFHTKIGGA